MSRRISRRTFLRSAAALPMAGALVGCADRVQPAADAADRPPVVDAHLHCFAGKADTRFPYHAKAPYQPEKSATPEHLLSCMDAAGVDFAVVVHPEPYQDDHRYLGHCLGVGGKRLKGTALVFADSENSDLKLALLVKRLGVVAARIHAYAPDRLPPFGKPELRRLWKSAADRGIAVQLHFEPRYAAGFTPLIREFSKTTVIIDHLGRPFQGSPEEHAVVVDWAKLPNTIMKLSAIPKERQYPHREPSAVVRQLTDAWGPERCIYGGGYGEDATGASYAAERERTRAFLSHLSAADQGKVFGGNAARLFGFKS